MKVTIQIISERQGGESEQQFEGDVLRIGRASDQDIRIDEIDLPLTIGEITEVSGQLILTATASNLIRVNGAVIRRHVLRADDQIAIADTTIVIEDASPSEARLAISNTAPRSKKRCRDQNSRRGFNWTIKKVA